MTTLPPVPAAPTPPTPPVPSAALYRAEIEAALLKVFLDMPVVSATVVARTPQGATVLATPRGEVTIPDGPDLPPGTEVAVRVVSQSPLTISLRAAPRSEAPPPAAASPTVLVEQGPVLEATLVRTNDALLPAGTRVPVRIVSVDIPPTARGEPRPAAATDASARATIASLAPAAKPGPVLGAMTEAVLPDAVVQIDPSDPTALPPPTRATPSSQPPRLASPPTATSAAPETARPAIDPVPYSGRPLPEAPFGPAQEDALVARVVRQTPGATVLSASVGLLSVQGLKAPEEALVRFVFAAPPAENRERARTPVRHAWSALGAALRVLEAAAPRMAERVAADLQPKNPEPLAATVRLLAAAQRESAPPPVPAEIGEALATLGQAALADDLRSEFAAPRSAPAAAAAEGWQVVAFPIHDGTSLRPAQLYVEDEAARRRRAADAPSRFVIEVGALQFDGLLRPRRFDLLLRSRASLREEIRAEIERIFRGTIDACGWTGEIAFSTVPAFPARAEQLRVSA